MTDLPRAVRALWGLDEPAGRRGPKRTLSVPAIGAAAVEIADADGLAAVSMASVAQRLGTTAMSLYRYVDSRQELEAVMVDVAHRPAPRAEPAPLAGAASSRTGPGPRPRQLAAHPWALERAAGLSPGQPEPAGLDRRRHADHAPVGAGRAARRVGAAAGRRLRPAATLLLGLQFADPEASAALGRPAAPGGRPRRDARPGPGAGRGALEDEPRRPGDFPGDGVRVRPGAPARRDRGAGGALTLEVLGATRSRRRPRRYGGPPRVLARPGRRWPRARRRPPRRRTRGGRAAATRTGSPRSGRPSAGRRCRGPSRAPARTCSGVVRSGFMLPEAASPMPPVMAAARSVMMSPNRLSVTITSNRDGSVVRKIIAASTWM